MSICLVHVKHGQDNTCTRDARRAPVVAKTAAIRVDSRVPFKYLTEGLFVRGT